MRWIHLGVVLLFAIAVVIFLVQNMAVVTMSFLGVACFVLVPAAPPWAAAACRPVDVQGGASNPACIYFGPRYVGSHSLLGLLHTSHPGATPWVERLSGRGWGTLHIPVARQLID